LLSICNYRQSFFCRTNLFPSKKTNGNSDTSYSKRNHYDNRN